MAHNERLDSGSDSDSRPSPHVNKLLPRQDLRLVLPLRLRLVSDTAAAAAAEALQAQHGCGQGTAWSGTAQHSTAWLGAGRLKARYGTERRGVAHRSTGGNVRHGVPR